MDPFKSGRFILFAFFTKTQTTKCANSTAFDKLARRILYTKAKNCAVLADDSDYGRDRRRRCDSLENLR